MISQLPSNLINKIAAGEVVERPASVVKELVENSIDAGASKIEIFIKDYGTDLILIRDNGHGIEKNDFKKLLLKHSTSKIRVENDLESINTFGFRGEALASIGSVAEVIISTRHEKDETGTELNFENSVLKVQKPSAIQLGTEIKVIKLFDNIPARKKFLKSKATETKAIIDIVNKFVLIHPEIEFKITIDKIVRSYSSSSMIERIKQVLKVTDNSLIPIKEAGFFKISGALIHPKIFYRNRANQFIFVNSRPVQDNTVGKAISYGYGTFLMKNQIPGYVLNIDVNPAEIDVNVHPRKTEIRFANPSQIYIEIRRAVDKVLKQNSQNELRTRFERLKNNEIDNSFGETKNQNNASETYSRKEKEIENKSTLSEFEAFLRSDEINSQKHKAKINSGLVEKALDFSEELIRDKREIYESEEQKSEAKKSGESYESEWIKRSERNENLQLDFENISQLLNSYILTSNQNSILVIDQHAASERYFFEKYLKKLKAKKVPSKSLLFAERISFSEENLDLILEKSEILETLGFNIEASGPNELRINAVPEFVRMDNFPRIFREICESIIAINEVNESVENPIFTKIAASLACHTAVRFGDKLKKDEMIAILKNLQNCEDPYNCPHGRPIIQEFSQSELEKKFRRCGV